MHLNSTLCWTLHVRISWSTFHTCLPPRLSQAQPTSEPKEIGGSNVLYRNPNLIKPIPVKPNTQVKHDNSKTMKHCGFKFKFHGKPPPPFAVLSGQWLWWTQGPLSGHTFWFQKGTAISQTWPSLSPGHTSGGVVTGTPSPTCSPHADLRGCFKL